jgi:hypothetical protein
VSVHQTGGIWGIHEHEVWRPFEYIGMVVIRILRVSHGPPSISLVELVHIGLTRRRPMKATRHVVSASGKLELELKVEIVRCIDELIQG